MQCIAMERLYADAQDAGFEQAFSGIRKNLQGCRDAKVDTIILKCRNASAFGKIRKGLIIKPLNYALHFHDLADCVYRRVGEVTLVLCLLLGDTADVLTTSRITKEEIKAWGMEGKEQEILQEALENTAKLFPACVYDWRIKAEVDFLSSDVKKDDMRAPTGQILLSTKRVVNGAAALFYPGVVEKMMQVMGGEFVAVFLNVNDAMIFEPEDPESISFAYTAKHSLDHVEMLSTKRYLCNEDGIHTIQ